MSLQDLLNVSISSATVSPTRPGFGTPMLAGFHTHYTDRIRFYTNLAGLTGDGFFTTEPIYRAAQVAFAANPAPAKIAIGRRALANTQAVALTLSSASTLDTYAFSAIGWDGGAHAFSFASTGVPATDAATLVTAWNAATMSTMVQTSGTSPLVTLTGTPLNNEDVIIQITTTGSQTTAVFKWSSNGGGTYTTGVTAAATVSLAGTGLTANFPVGTFTIGATYQAASTNGFAVAASAVVTFTQLGIGNGAGQTANTAHQGRLCDFLSWNPSGSTQPILSLQDNTTDPGIATDLAAIQAFALPGSYYGVSLDSNSQAEVTAAANYVEGAGAFIYAFNNSDQIDITNSTLDVFSVQKAAAHARSGGLFSGSQLLSYAGFGWLAKTLPQNPGSLTFMYKTLASVLADNLSESAQLNLNGKNANYYITLAGINITVNGWSGSGAFLDITWGTDALTSQIQIDVFALLAGAPKVPYTDLGVDMIKSTIMGDLVLFSTPAYNFIATNPQPTVTAPAVATVAPATRASRSFPNIAFSGKLAGAIQTLTIQGVLSA